MEMGQNFLPFGFNLLDRLTGIAVNSRIRNHQARFYTQLQRVKADIPDEFNGFDRSDKSWHPDRLDSYGQWFLLD